MCGVYGIFALEACGYVPGPRPMFRGIRKLPVASLLVCENGSVDVRRYWRLPQPDGESDERERVERTRNALERTVVAQMVGNVPLGAFLSVGIHYERYARLVPRWVLRRLLALLNFELWCRLYRDERPHEEVAAQLHEEAVR